MVGRVAQAVLAFCNDETERRHVDDPPDQHSWDKCVSIAIEVLGAMREPTEEMVVQGILSQVAFGAEERDSMVEMRRTFSAMIDAALAEKTDLFSSF